MRKLLAICLSVLMVFVCTAETSTHRALTVVAAGDAFMVQAFPRGYSPDASMKEWIASGDVRLVNFEAVVNDGTCSPAAWSGGTWAVMPPAVFGDFRTFGFNACGCANNHSLDYSREGLEMTLNHLAAADIRACGTGRDLAEASQPAIVRSAKGKVAVLSVTAEFHPDARAGLTTSRSPGRPGVNALRHSSKYFVTAEHMEALRSVSKGTLINGWRTIEQRDGFIGPDPEGTFAFGDVLFEQRAKEGRTSWCNPADLARLTDDIRRASAEADAVIVLAHSHDIRGDRSEESDYYFEEFCRAAVDAGATAVFGGGEHKLKGIEFRNGHPIFYSLGDFVFQNNVTPSVPPDFCEKYGVALDSDAATALAARSKGGKVGLHVDRMNYLSVLPKLEIEDGAVKSVRMLPIELHFGMDWSVNGLPRTADAEAGRTILTRLSELSAPYGTEVTLGDDGILLAVPKASEDGSATDDARALMKELVGIPSVSSDISQVNRAVASMKTWLERRGVSCAVETAVCGRNVLWASTCPGKEQDIVLVCHLDVVPAPEDMFSLAERDGRIYGRGACDCKANAVVCAEVLSGMVGKASVGCVFSTDEELGGFTTALMVARGYRPRKMAIVVDLSEYGVVCAHKGHALLRLVAHGSKGHSSLPWKSVNALELLMAGCAKLRQEWNRAYGTASENDPWHDTLSITMASSSSEVANAVPDLAEARASLRYVEADGRARAIDFLKKMSGFDVEVIRDGGPVNSDPNHPLMVVFLETMRRVWNDPKLEFSRINGATDARHLGGLGIPVVVIGSESGGAHTDEEWCDLSGLQKLRDALNEFILRSPNFRGRSF